MKRLLSVLCCTALFSIAALRAQAIDITGSISLERYTVLTNGSLQYETGNLLKTGQFRVFTSEIVDPLYYDTLDPFIPISGKPIMNEMLFNAYKADGIIPSLRRSRYDFTIGFETYVIVAIAGRGDPNPAITIESQPESERALLGDPAYFYIIADPDPYISYQWMFRGKPLAGETSFDFWINAVSPTNAGIYRVAMNTGGRTVLSKPALLTIVKPVAITSEPKSQTVKTGKPAVFRVAVSGTPPFAYQWFWDRTAISNATKSFFSIPHVQGTNAGNYVVVVANGETYAVSSNAVLTVSP